MKEQQKIDNSLLNSLISFSKLYHKPTTVERMTQGLALKQGMDKYKIFSQQNRGLEDAFSRVTSNIGFTSKLIHKQKLKHIPKMLFPLILLLKDDKSCILLEFNRGNSHAKIIMPEVSENKAYWVETKDLKKEFTGSFFLLKEELKDETSSVRNDKKHWFWSSLSYSKGLYFDVIIASFLLNIFMLATPLFTMNVYDRVIPNSAFDTLWVFATAIGIVYLFDFLMKILRTYTLEVVAKKSDVLISSRMFEYLLKIKLSNRFSSVGSFASNLREFDTIRSFFTSTSMATMIDLPFLLIFLGVIFIIGGNLVFVPIFSALLIIFYALLIKRPLKKSIDNVSKSSAYKNAILIESLSAIETIKSFSLENSMQWKWEESVGQIAKDEIRSRLLSVSISTFSNFIIQLSTVAILILGVYAISEQKLSMGALIALVMLTSRTLAPLNQFAGLISNYEQTKQSYRQLDEIMNLPTDYQDGQRFVERQKIEGVIEFKNVKFKYSNKTQYVLDDVSFKINADEKVGIIGTNASGKSTILKLIMGLYEPESGSILIDGIDIRQINPYSLRKHMAYVPQEVILFKGTLQENILNTVENVSDEGLIRACKQSALENFIRKNPLGYNMTIEERGLGLSGGERQSIAVARAFIKTDATVVLLDEPTNSMDSNNEAVIEKNLPVFIKNKTMLLITHKQSLLKLSKRLLLLQDGKLLLDDSYENVLKVLSLKGKK